MSHEMIIAFRVHYCKYVLSILLVFLVGIRTSDGQAVGEISWTPCPSVDCSDIHEPERVKFGYITVPEDYKQPERSRRLQVAFAIIKARSKNRKPDPVILFAGGWGSPILSRIPYYLEYPLGEERDLILYDYRGLGYSEPPICPGLGEEVYSQLTAASSYQVFSVWQRDRFDQCLDDLGEAAIDHNLYGTEERSLDANLLGMKLGYDEYNVFGTSGGTATIQRFLHHATVPVRAAILDSTVPKGYPMIFESTGNFAESLVLVLDRCKQDGACSKAYPQLKERYLAFLEDLDKKPMKLRLKGRTKVFLNRQEVNALVFNQLYDYQNLRFVPFFLDALIKRKKFVLRRIIRPWEIEQMVTEAVNGPGFLNYMNDYKAFQHGVEASLSTTLSEYEVLDAYWVYYVSDRRFEASEKERIPVKSEVPTLFLSGEYDPTTRPHYTELLLPNFSNSTHLKFPNAGHGLFFDDCAQVSMQAFLDNLTSFLPPRCVKEYDESSLNFFIRGRRSR